MKIKGTPKEVHFSSLLEEIYTRSLQLMEACDTLSEMVVDTATKKNTYQSKRATALSTVKDGKNKEEREARVDSQFSEERLEFFKAEGLENAQLERVRSLRQVLSSLQTIANTNKVEMEAFQYGQSGT